MREYNFDGLVGPTHHYGGLSPGNVASVRHGGQASNPRRAALQGLEKMKFVAGLGVGQAVLPPQPRPQLRVLRALGFSGSDEEVLSAAAAEPPLLRLCASASSMWAANAATCAPSADAADGRLHLTPANLTQFFHRAIEADTTRAVLASVFRGEGFTVHAPLPGGGQFADEGAANHVRLSAPGKPAVHLFAWGRTGTGAPLNPPAPQRHPARQTLEASRALARLHRLAPGQCLFPRQTPEGIEAGAFHTDVLAVGNGPFLMLHEKAFCEGDALLNALRKKLGADFHAVVATEGELPVSAAVAAYPFNSQVLTLPSGRMAVVAPEDSREEPAARHFLERVVAEDNPVEAVHYLDVNQSMDNGGGPACLRLRVWLEEEERRAISANVFYSPELHEQLERWIHRHYRDRLVPEDLADPALAREGMAALDELTALLKLGSVYDFQAAPVRQPRTL